MRRLARIGTPYEGLERGQGAAARPPRSRSGHTRYDLDQPDDGVCRGRWPLIALEALTSREPAAFQLRPRLQRPLLRRCGGERGRRRAAITPLGRAAASPRRRAARLASPSAGRTVTAAAPAPARCEIVPLTGIKPLPPGWFSSGGGALTTNKGRHGSRTEFNGSGARDGVGYAAAHSATSPVLIDGRQNRHRARPETGRTNGSKAGPRS